MIDGLYFRLDWLHGLIIPYFDVYELGEEVVHLMGTARDRIAVTRRPYCPGGTKKLCFTTLSLIPMASIARLNVVKQSSFGLPGQYGRRVTRVNSQIGLGFSARPNGPENLKKVSCNRKRNASMRIDRVLAPQ